MRVRDGKAWEIGRLASGSHGVVTREELLRAGLSRSAIGRSIDAGGLLVVHRGVYRVGHRAPSVEATYLAAVRAAGVRSVYAWEQDRRRERQAHARGDHHRRYTHHNVYDDPREMLAELTDVLEDRPGEDHDQHDRPHHGDDVDQEAERLGL